MHKKIFGVVYALNIFFQSFFSLAMPTGFFAVIAWFLVSQISAPLWIYVPFIAVGVLLGFYSMIKFIITASSTLEHLESEQEAKERNKKDFRDNNK